MISDYGSKGKEYNARAPVSWPGLFDKSGVGLRTNLQAEPEDRLRKGLAKGTHNLLLSIEYQHDSVCLNVNGQSLERDPRAYSPAEIR